MPSADAELSVTKCLFCRMPTRLRFLRLPLCEICRDQMYDFLWASGVQGALVVAGLIGGVTFLVEEVLLFTVLVFVKHRMPPHWLRHGGSG